MSDDRRRPGHKKRDHPSPIREHYGQGGYPYPAGGRGGPPWAAKRGRMDSRTPWGRGMRMPMPDMRQDRYPSGRRSPSHFGEEDLRGNPMHRSPLWAGPPGPRGANYLPEGPRGFNGPGVGRGPHEVDRRAPAGMLRPWERQREAPRPGRESFSPRETEHYRPNPRQAKPRDGSPDLGWRNARLPPPPTRRSKDLEPLAYESRERSGYPPNLPRGVSLDREPFNYPFPPPPLARRDLVSAPSPRRSSRRSPHRSKSPRRRHSHKDRSREHKKSREGPRDRSSSQSRKGTDKDNKDSFKEKATKGVPEEPERKLEAKVEAEPEPKVEAMPEAEPAEEVAVELQMSPVTPRGVSPEREPGEPAEEEPASAVEPSAMADAVEENSVAPLRTAPSPPERKEASNAAVVSAEPGREDALASTPQGKPVDLPISSKEMCSDDPPKRKRLGWGQGLARLQSKDARASGEDARSPETDTAPMIIKAEPLERGGDPLMTDQIHSPIAEVPVIESMKSPFGNAEEQDLPTFPSLPSVATSVSTSQAETTLPSLAPGNPMEGSPQPAASPGNGWQAINTPVSPVSPTLPSPIHRSSSVLTPHASQEILQSPKKSVTSPGNQAEADRDFGADALLVPDRPPPSQPPLAEPQISKVAILLAIEKVDAEIEAVNSKLAALAARIDSGRNRIPSLEAEHASLQIETRMHSPPPESSLDEAISSMSEDSADSSNQQVVPNGIRRLTSVSSSDEDEASPRDNVPTSAPADDSDAGSTSGASAESSITAASVPAEPLPNFPELVEKVQRFPHKHRALVKLGKKVLLENNKTARQTHVEAGLTQKAAFAHFKDGAGYVQPADFPRYHQTIKDHVANHEKLLAAVAHHKQHVWEKELAVTLEYRELYERYRTYYYKEFGNPRGAAGLGERAGGSMPRAASRKLAAARGELEERRMALQKTAVDRIQRLALCLSWPDQKLDDWSRKYSIFPSENAKVADPVALLKHEAAVRPWSDEEKKIFLDKYLSHVKDFHAIASYLEHRSTEDCVQFYYKIQKSDDFATVRRKQQLKKRRAQSETNKQMSYMGMGSMPSSARDRGGTTAMAAAVPPDDLVGMVPMSRKVQMRGGVRGRGGSAMASAIAMSLSGPEPILDEPPLQPALQQPWEQMPDHVHGWTPQEEALLARGLVIFGRDFKAIAKNMGLNRTAAACKSFFSKNKVRYQLEEALQQHKQNAAFAEGQGGDEIREGDEAEPVSPNAMSRQDYPFGGSAEMPHGPPSPQTLPVPEAGQDMMSQAAMMQEPPMLLPSDPHGLVPQDTQGMHPQTEGMAHLLGQPYLGLSTAGSAGFQSQPYNLPQLGPMFPPNQGPPAGPGMVLPQNSQLGIMMQLQMLQNPQMQQMAASMLNFPPQGLMGTPPNLYSLLLASMSGGQGMPFPPQLLAGFPGMQGGGMGFLGHLANPNNLQSLLPPELMQQFQQQMDLSNSEEQRAGSGHLLAEETVPGEQLREEPHLEEATNGNADGLSRRSASMWTPDEKTSFLDCFKVHGRDWKQLGKAVPNKTETQIKNYFQNYKAKLGLDRMELPPSAIHPGQRRRKAENRQHSTPVPSQLEISGLSMSEPLPAAKTTAGSGKPPTGLSDEKTATAEGSKPDDKTRVAALTEPAVARSQSSDYPATTTASSIDPSLSGTAPSGRAPQTYTIPAAQWRDQTVRQSSDPVKPKDTEANISQSALEQLEQMTSAPGPSVQNLLQLLKSDLFQGDRGSGGGDSAFPALRPDHLAEYMSRNAHLFLPPDSLQASLPSSVDPPVSASGGTNQVQVVPAFSNSVQTDSSAMPSSTPGATDLPPASKVEDVQASSLVEEDAKPQDTCKPAANEGAQTARSHTTGNDAGPGTAPVPAAKPLQSNAESPAEGQGLPHLFGTADALAALGASQGVSGVSSPAELSQRNLPGELGLKLSQDPEVSGVSSSDFLKPLLQQAARMHSNSGAATQTPSTDSNPSSVPTSSAAVLTSGRKSADASKQHLGGSSAEALQQAMINLLKQNTLPPSREHYPRQDIEAGEIEIRPANGKTAGDGLQEPDASAQGKIANMAASERSSEQAEIGKSAGLEEKQQADAARPVVSDVAEQPVQVETQAGHSILTNALQQLATSQKPEQEI